MKSAMPGKSKEELVRSVSLVLLIGLVLSFPFSRGVASVLIGAMALVMIFQLVRTKFPQPPQKWFYWFLIGYLALYLINDLFHLNEGFRLTVLKLPILIGFVFVLTRDFSRNQWTFVIAAAVLMVLSISSVSVIGYFGNKEEIDALLLQSKHIPVATGMHHIQFGVINALVTGGTAFILVFYNPFQKQLYAVLAWLVVVVLLINLHILSSRTGLLGFYAAVGTVILTAALNKEQRRKALVISLAVVVGVLINLGFNDSLKNKVQNSSNDLEAARKGGEHINFNSMSMRLEAYENAFFIIQNHPVGLGAYQVNAAMNEAYEERKTVLIEENRIGPHNQFLEEGIRWGIFGIAAILILFAPFGFSIVSRGFPPVEVFSLVLVGISFLLESQLERQYGIITFAFLMPVFIQYSRNFIQQKEGE